MEVYSTAKIPRSGIPKVVVTFSAPRINGVALPSKQITAYYPDKGGPDSPDCAKITADGTNCVVTVGPIFKRPEAERRHVVAPAPAP